MTTVADIIGANALATEYARLYVHVDPRRARQFAETLEAQLTEDNYKLFLGCVDACVDYTKPNARMKRHAKRARKLMQRPWNRPAEAHKETVRRFEALREQLASILAYRDCWQYGRHVHGAVSGSYKEAKQGVFLALHAMRAARPSAQRSFSIR